MVSLEKVQELKLLLDKDYSWLNDNPPNIPEILIEYSLAIKKLKNEIKKHSPYIYGSVSFSRSYPQLFDSFVQIHESVNDFSPKISESLSRAIDNVDRSDSYSLDQLKYCCKNNEDEGNYHRIRRLHNQEEQVRAEAMEGADEDYLGLKNRFYRNNWRVRDISRLEEMLEKSDLVVEKGRFLEDTELVYHGSELSNQMAGVLNNLRRRRSRSRKTAIGVAAGVLITAFSLIQHYLPPEPVQEKAKEVYEATKEVFNRESNKSE